MGEADWWLCTSCSSLNNLAARKCYSCGHGKPRGAVRASEYLGYRPVVSWDGKVKLEQLTARERSATVVTPVAGPEKPQRPALREPVLRDTLAIAPRPPHPARITYRLDEPSPGGMPLPERPLVAVGPGPNDEPGRPVEPWSHWRELLDGPVPHADQLRNAFSGNQGTLARKRSGSERDGLTLRSAIRLARTGDAREFIPWPEVDRPRPEDQAADQAEPASPAGDGLRE